MKEKNQFINKTLRKTIKIFQFFKIEEKFIIFYVFYGEI